jgi:hypothetical protein
MTRCWCSTTSRPLSQTRIWSIFPVRQRSP